MAGYSDTRQLIIDTLMGRPAGTEIQPEDHQAFALQIIDYIRSVELVAGSGVPVEFAEPDTVPVQPDNGQAVYLSYVPRNVTKNFVNFINQSGNSISVTSSSGEVKLVTLLWNGSYWSSQIVTIDVLSDDSSVNASNIGASDYILFSTSSNYSIGDIVRYDGKLYKFTAEHAAGTWNGTDVELASINSILTSKLSELEGEILDIEGEILDIRGGEIVENYTSEDFKEVASSWSISSNKVVNISPSNPNARALTNPIHLNEGDKVVLQTAIYSAYQYMYIVADAEQNVILSVQPTGEAGVLETLEYTATSECYFYANGMTTKDFSCAVTSEKVGSLEELKSRVTDLEKEVNGQEEKHTDTDYSTFGISHNYFNANLAVISSARYDMTDYIPVSKGNVIIMSAQSDSGIAMVVGYSDNQGNGATALLTGNVQVANKEVLIPNGVNYVRCCARNLAFSQVTALMSVTLRVIESIAYEGINQKIDALDIRIDSLEVSTIGDKIVVPKNKKILLVGASFTIPENGWDKLVQDTLGCEIVNKAVGGSNIINNVADLMLDADASKPHGSLFMVNGVDIFNDVSALVIQHVHNKNVLLDKALYEQRDTAWYKTNGIPSGDYASGFDYVLKQYKEWCNATASVTETIQDVTRESIYGTHPCQILLVSHWLPSRALYNATSRQLASRFNVSYCPIDTNVGISAKDMVYCTESTDAQPTPTLGYYNPSVLLAQFVNVASGNPIGKTEVIDGVTWGWHPLLLSSTRNYGYGTIVNRQGVTQYVPYIARLIANIVVDCIKVFE